MQRMKLIVQDTGSDMLLMLECREVRFQSTPWSRLLSLSHIYSIYDNMNLNWRHQFKTHNCTHLQEIA